jgi:hypothetical protein
MARTWTKQEFENKVLLEHDLQEESFISTAEMTNYINEGIDWAESLVVGLYEDYYLDRTEWLPIVDETTMPANIYANKLRRVEICTSPEMGEVRQIFKNSNLDPHYFGYNIFHKTGESPKIVFENIPTEFNYYRLTFTRNANRVVNGNDIIDLPEVAVYYAQQFVKMRCYQKERDQMAFKASDEILAMEQAMTDALTNITNDGSDNLEPDVSFYNEFDSEFYFY